MPQNDWLVVFLIYADFRVQGFKNNEKTFRELENVLKDLKKCKISKGTKIVFALNGIRFTKNGQEADYTYIYEVKRGWLFQKNRFECIEVVDNGNSRTPVRPLSINQLNLLFCKLKEAINYSGERIILNTWDHGSAFGIFRESNPTIEDPIEDESKYPVLLELLSKPQKDGKEKSILDFLKETSKIPVLEDLVLFTDYSYYSLDLTPHIRTDFIGDVPTIFKKIREKIYEGIITKSEDKITVEIIGNENFRSFSHLANNTSLKFDLKKDGEILTNIELSDAIKKSFGKVEVLTMMNCWMMNLDSLFTFKDCVNYLVAPPSNIDEPGYNYYQIINSINSRISEEELAKIPVDSMENKPSKYRKEYFDGIIESSIISTSLKDVDYLINAFIGLSEKLMQLIKQNGFLKYHILYYRSFCPKLDNKGKYHLIDMGLLIQAILRNNDKLLDWDLEKPFLIANTAISDFEKTNSITCYFNEKMFSNHDIYDFQLKNRPSGFSIIFPMDKTRLDEALRLPFVEHSLFINLRNYTWRNFLNQLLS